MQQEARGIGGVHIEFDFVALVLERDFFVAGDVDDFACLEWQVLHPDVGVSVFGFVADDDDDGVVSARAHGGFDIGIRRVNV